MASSVTLEKIVALCKRRGFVFPTAEIYGGLNGVYDFGPLGTLVKQNIHQLWLDALYASTDDIVLFDGAILGPHALWQASGHTESFCDPMIDCMSCKKRFRADDIDIKKPCPHCGNTAWTDVREFQLMFQTNVGALADSGSIAYLRPETAQPIFANFKNIMNSSRTKIPFGVAQIGKAFRNEITPKQFLFRVREFEQMEFEWFCTAQDAPKFFDQWLAQRQQFLYSIGLKKENLRLHEQTEQERAHYSAATTDIEYQFPFGWKELEGVANRGNYDLWQHTKASGKELSVYDEETKESYIPHVVECSVGADRLFLALMCDAYDEDEADGEQRIVLRYNPRVAPVKVAVLPLAKKLAEHSEKLYRDLKKRVPHIQHDIPGSIGKRYRRQDEIGTPLCITYDFESLEDHAVTVRDRDSMKQERVAIDKLPEYIDAKIG